MREIRMLRSMSGERKRIAQTTPRLSSNLRYAASWRKLTKQRNQALSIDVDAATP